MYRMLEFREEERLPSACEFSGGIALGGLSKSWGCPGLRVGWLASQNDRFLAECAAYRDYVTICSSAPAEILGIVALRQTESLTHQHRERVLKNIRTAETLIASSMPFIEWRAPRAGPIAFPKLVEGGARRYAERWVEEKGLLLLPSDLYGTSCVCVCVHVCSVLFFLTFGPSWKQRTQHCGISRRHLSLRARARSDYGDHHFRMGFGRDSFAEALGLWATGLEAK